MQDKVTGKDITLTDEEIDLIHKIQSIEYPSENLDPYAVSYMLNYSFLIVVSTP